MLGLIWVQTVCKVQMQMTKSNAGRQTVKMLGSRKFHQGVLQTIFKSSTCFTEGHRDLLREVPYQYFLRKHKATCDFPGVGLGPLSPPPLNMSMGKEYRSLITDLAYTYVATLRSSFTFSSLRSLGFILPSNRSFACSLSWKTDSLLSG